MVKKKKKKFENVGNSAMLCNHLIWVFSFYFLTYKHHFLVSFCLIVYILILSSKLKPKLKY